MGMDKLSHQLQMNGMEIRELRSGTMKDGNRCYSVSG
jgi:hypothetical protein